MRAAHQITLLQGGAEFFSALVKEIDASHSEVRLETYIFNFDASGQRVASALERAAQRGVAVYLLMDGIGTPLVPQAWALRLNAAGIHWQRFSPLGRWGLLVPLRWRRLHRKLCVVDQRVAFCGGINILDDWVDPEQGALSSARFDFAVQVTGPLVVDIHVAMSQFWSRLMATRQLSHLRLWDARKTWQAAIALPLTHTVDSVGLRAALVLRDNVRNRSSIERAYRKAIAGARDEIVIANAYFLPGGKLRRALAHAVKRGVRVRLLLHGTYESFMQFHAVRPVLRSLLDAGVEIHEYRAGLLHAKVAVVDGHWATVGSSNLDPLSLLLAREANVVVDNTEFAQELRARLLLAMHQHGIRLGLDRNATRPWHHRVLDQLAYGLTRLILFVTGRRY